MDKDYVIVVDSCSDLSKQLREEYGIKYVKMNIIKKTRMWEKRSPCAPFSKG